MSKKLNLSIVLLVVFSMLLGACAPAASVDQARPVEAPVTQVVQVPATDVVQTQPDVAALYAAMVKSLPTGYASIKPVDLNTQLASATAPFLLDVREAAELQADGFIKGAVNIPVRTVLKNLDKLPTLDTNIVVYCGSGQRGGMVLGALRLLGYKNVINLGGGLAAWKAAKLPVETGSMPADAKSISTPIIADKALFTMVDSFLSTLPDGFLALKADKVAAQIASATPPTLIDLRTADERLNNGYIKGSINIPFGDLFTSLDKLPAKDAPIIVYCGSGQRGSIALTGLYLLGYKNVINLGGGFGAWKTAKLPVDGVVDWTGTWADFLKNMPAGYYTVKSDVVNGQIQAGNAPFIIDVREPAEIEKSGYIKGAVNIPLRDLLKNLDKLPGLDKPIVVYCAIGHRGAMAMASLRLLGYTNVLSLGGGFNAWANAKLPVETGTPVAPVAGTAANVDLLRLNGLNNYLTALPDNFYGIADTDVVKALGSATPPVVIDVRTADEVKANGFIKGSVFIPVNDLLTDMTKLPADKTTPIIVVCQSGHRGAVATMALRMIGYTNVNSMFSGLNKWTADKLPLEK